MSVAALADKECVPCKGGVPALDGEALARLYAELGASWDLVDGHHLEKSYKFENFRKALEFTNQVGELAESVNHHPELHLGWGRVRIEIWTHKVGGLTESDFVFAAKVEELT